MFDITQDFDLAEWCSNVLKSQQKYNIAIVIQLSHNTNVIPTAGLYMLTIMMLDVPRCSGSVHGLKPAQTCCCLQSSFCWLFSFYTVLSRAAYRLPPSWSGCLRKIILSLDCFREGHLHSLLTHSTNTAFHLQQRPRSGHLCVEMSSVSFTTAVVPP